jgi:hypothetical protein
MHIPRILFAFRWRATDSRRSMSDVDCRRKWKTSMGVDTHRSASAGMGEEPAICCTAVRSHVALGLSITATGKKWKGWRF